VAVGIKLKISSFYPGKYFGKIEIGQKNVQKRKEEKSLSEIHVL
jgi:hypothetical protein